jgi:peptidoglycan/xylan/chitin deacetylase (PgdA/CDA1 family)
MKAPPPVAVLLYHDLLPPNQFLADAGFVPVDRYQEHIAALLAAGFECVPLSTAFDLAINAPHQPVYGSPKFAVTFDDGYAGLHDYLADLAVAVHPTVFLVTGHVGKPNLWNTRCPVVRQHLSLAQIRDLASAGISVEDHGPDHHNLLKFNYDEMCARARESIAWFEDNLARAPSYLAFPYGACNAVVWEFASEFYRGAVSVNHGFWSGEATRFALNRISVPAFLTGADLVDIVRCRPDRRYIEMERRAPWRATRRKRSGP